jgi:hypothetical protein
MRLIDYISVVAFLRTKKAPEEVFEIIKNNTRHKDSNDQKLFCGSMFSGDCSFRIGSNSGNFDGTIRPCFGGSIIKFRTADIASWVLLVLFTLWYLVLLFDLLFGAQGLNARTLIKSIICLLPQPLIAIFFHLLRDSEFRRLKVCIIDLINAEVITDPVEKKKYAAYFK